MAKEEELKRVDLKVNVSCCDGCRRKVMKAMSLKGVLRTEIHPSLDRVTVVGNVDTKVLVKKLAKVGKIAELVPLRDEQPKKREGDGGKDRDGGDMPMPALAGEKSKRKDEAKDKDKRGDKAAVAGATVSSKNKDCHKCAHQQSARGDDAADHGKAPSTKDATGSAFKEEDDSFSFGERSAPDHAPAAHQHYHRAEPPSMAVPVHMPYYAPANMTAPSYYAPANVMAPSYYAAASVTAPSYYGGGYYAMPPPMMPMPLQQQQPQMLIRPQPSRFDVDYFNEDNTVGCSIM